MLEPIISDPHGSITTTSSNKPETRRGECSGHPRGSCNRAIEQRFIFSRYLPQLCDECAEAEQAELDARERADAEKAAEENFRSALAATGIGRKQIEERNLEMTLRPPQKAAWDAIDALVRGDAEKPMIVLAGGTGSGKTTLAARGVIAFTKTQKGRAIFTTVADLLLRIRATYSASSTHTELEVIDRFRYAPLLVIDDLGAEKASSHTAATLLTIIDARYSNGLRTIFTTNLRPADLAAHLAIADEATTADRIVDRIREAARWLTIDGPSFRKAVAADRWRWTQTEQPAKNC